MTPDFSPYQRKLFKEHCTSIEEIVLIKSSHSSPEDDLLVCYQSNQKNKSLTTKPFLPVEVFTSNELDKIYNKRNDGNIYSNIKPQALSDFLELRVAVPHFRGYEPSFLKLGSLSRKKYFKPEFVKKLEECVK